MPTDPFVAPDPTARPRQQQNLPPGVALPAPASWRADRPGDAAEPSGAPLFGTPGPNVGYAYTLAQRAKSRFRTAPTEDIASATAVAAEIAGRRAAAFGRAPVMSDVDYAMTLLGYDGSADDAFADARARLVHDADHSYPRRRAIVDAVPDTLLRRPVGDLAALVGEWRDGLKVRLLDA